MTNAKRFPARQDQVQIWNPKYTRFLGQPVALEEVGPPGVLLLA